MSGEQDEAIDGTVRWFNASKGYGFLIADNNPGEELFVHYSQILKEGYRTLHEGERVSFRVEARRNCTTGTEGKQAVNVRSLPL